MQTKIIIVTSLFYGCCDLFYIYTHYFALYLLTTLDGRFESRIPYLNYKSILKIANKRHENQEEKTERLIFKSQPRITTCAMFISIDTRPFNIDRHSQS